jgi:hypothetical protein
LVIGACLLTATVASGQWAIVLGALESPAFAPLPALRKAPSRQPQAGGNHSQRHALPAGSLIPQAQASSRLLDAAGQKVPDLAPGPNDVRNLRAGVYFVHETGAQTQTQVIRKVLITK